MPEMIDKIEVSDALGSLVHASRAIITIFELAGDSGGLTNDECQALGILLNSYTNDLNESFLRLMEQ